MLVPQEMLAGGGLAETGKMQTLMLYPVLALFLEVLQAMEEPLVTRAIPDQRGLLGRHLQDFLKLFRAVTAVTAAQEAL